MRVRHRRLAAAAAITDRSRLRAGALRPHHQDTGVADAGDRAPTGADRDHVDHGQTDRPTPNAAAGGEAWRAAADEGDVGRGAADVDANEIRVATGGAEVGGAHRPRRWPGQRRFYRG